MYRKRDDLQLLVNAMSGSERRYFTAFSKAFNAEEENPLYLQLFDVLKNGQSQLPIGDFGTSEKALTNTKRRLYDNIMRCMRLYYQDNSGNTIIQNLLSEVEILHNHSLAEQALFQLNKAYNLAVTQEKFGLQLQCLEWESRLNVVLEKPTRPQDEILAEEETVLQKLKQYRFLESIYAKAELLKKQYGFARGDLKQELARATIHAPGMPKLSKCLSRKATFYHNFISALYYWMTFGHEHAFIYSQRLILPNKSAILPSDYINGLLEHITSCVCLCRFDDAFRGINIGMAYIEEENFSQSPAFVARMLGYKDNYELIMYIYMGRTKELRQAIRNTEGRLATYEHTWSFETKYILIGNLMNAYMALDDMKKADEIWHTMVNTQSKDIRRDIYGDLYLFRLFSLLKTKTYELVPSAALSAVRFYKKSPEAFPVELPIASLFQKAKNISSPEVRTSVITATRKIIESYLKKLNGVHGFQEHYTRYIIWCDALLNDRPFYEEAAEWYRRFRKAEQLNE